MAEPAAIALRLVRPGPQLLTLPWARPLATWGEADARFVELPVGTSRHLVRFCVVDGEVLAAQGAGPLAGAPRVRGPAACWSTASCRPSGRSGSASDRPTTPRSWSRASWPARSSTAASSSGSARARWRSGSGSSTRWPASSSSCTGGASTGATARSPTRSCVRDGQTLQAYLVDAETAEIHDQLSDGQRAFDLELMVENVAGDLADVAAIDGRGLEDDGRGHRGGRERQDPLLRPVGRAPSRGAGRARRALRGRGPPATAQRPGLRGRRGDVRAGPDGRRAAPQGRRSPTAGSTRRACSTSPASRWARARPRSCSTTSTRRPAPPGPQPRPEALGRWWLEHCLEPAVARLRATLGEGIDPIQAYCDLLEVRWLLSERAGADVGTDAALAALARTADPGRLGGRPGRRRGGDGRLASGGPARRRARPSP